LFTLIPFVPPCHRAVVMATEAGQLELSAWLSNSTINSAAIVTW
jgi:hypothetical protein